MDDEIVVDFKVTTAMQARLKESGLEIANVVK